MNICIVNNKNDTKNYKTSTVSVADTVFQLVEETATSGGAGFAYLRILYTGSRLESMKTPDVLALKQTNRSQLLVSCSFLPNYFNCLLK